MRERIRKSNLKTMKLNLHRRVSFFQIPCWHFSDHLPPDAFDKLLSPVAPLARISSFLHGPFSILAFCSSLLNLPFVRVADRAMEKNDGALIDFRESTYTFQHLLPFSYFFSITWSIMNSAFATFSFLSNAFRPPKSNTFPRRSRNSFTSF